MRGFASYMLAGILVVVAMDFIAPPVGLGLPVGAWPTVEQGSLVQSVNRSHKGDRLNVPTAVDKSQCTAQVADGAGRLRSGVQPLVGLCACECCA